ncbi:MAG: hypothetical protein EXQ86_05790 [Rhodospirillales bacterium]|nr:hypothetical protein [Rhodospirillales bacterium]
MDPAVALGLLIAPSAWAADSRCAVPEGLVYVDADLPHAAAALSGPRQLHIVVVGTASSTGAGVSQPGNAYPLQLERALARHLPEVQVSVVTKAERGTLAEAMVGRFEREVIPERPALVIWQTGTVEAVRLVDVDDFGETLAHGIDMLNSANIDVILMDMQYSPASMTLVNTGPYKDQMHWIAQEKDVLLFRRHEIMVRLSQDGMINLTSTDREAQKQNADLVHRCIGDLLADMIVRAAGVDLAARPKP